MSWFITRAFAVVVLCLMGGCATCRQHPVTCVAAAAVTGYAIAHDRVEFIDYREPNNHGPLRHP